MVKEKRSSGGYGHGPRRLTSIGESQAKTRLPSWTPFIRPPRTPCRHVLCEHKQGTSVVGLSGCVGGEKVKQCPWSYFEYLLQACPSLLGHESEREQLKSQNTRVAAITKRMSLSTTETSMKSLPLCFISRLPWPAAFKCVQGQENV